jgi:hypothetical protein
MFPYLTRSFFTAMEYLAGGPIQWSNEQHRPVLSTQQTRRIIRDVILGLEYRQSSVYAPALN